MEVTLRKFYIEESLWNLTCQDIRKHYAYGNIRNAVGMVSNDRPKMFSFKVFIYGNEAINMHPLQFDILILLMCWDSM